MCTSPQPPAQRLEQAPSFPASGAHSLLLWPPLSGALQSPQGAPPGPGMPQPHSGSCDKDRKQGSVLPQPGAGGGGDNLASLRAS